MTYFFYVCVIAFIGVIATMLYIHVISPTFFCKGFERHTFGKWEDDVFGKLYRKCTKCNYKFFE